MSDTVLVAMIAGIVASIPPLVTIVIAWLNIRAKQQELNVKAEEIKKETIVLHKTVNSRMDDLLDKTKIASAAEGKDAGRAEVKAELKDAAMPMKVEIVPAEKPLPVEVKEKGKP